MGTIFYYKKKNMDICSNFCYNISSKYYDMKDIIYIRFSPFIRMMRNNNSNIDNSGIDRTKTETSSDYDDDDDDDGDNDSIGTNTDKNEKLNIDHLYNNHQSTTEIQQESSMI